MYTEIQLIRPVEKCFDQEHLYLFLGDFLKFDSSQLQQIKILKKSLDARRKPILVRWVFAIPKASLSKEQFKILNSCDFIELTEKAELEIENRIQYQNANENSKKVHIIGFGPAGMFAALKALELGLKPVVIERGKAVKERRRDLALINKEGIINPDSNYCFGEGGAGTYSDGKLYTRSNKRGNIRKILQVFVDHGADERILYEAHPHIGTNKLPGIVENMRKTVLEKGGEIHFNSRLTDIILKNNQISHLIINGNTELKCDQVLLATGHSARDIFELLDQKNILIEAKAFALGVRIEHNQNLIDRIQYKCEERPDYLPPSAYSIVQQVAGRGVFSFCMCPGGIIAPASTAPGEIVVNGWSPSKRNGKFANSGLVVSVDENDFRPYQKFNALAGLKFQAEIEQKAFRAAGQNLKAPAQRASDFIRKKTSKDLPECSYIPGVQSSDLYDILPDSVSKRLAEALGHFNKKMPGYAGHDALLVAVESRTSSPVKIPRDYQKLNHPQIQNLFPCGEGAGYAGGIVSAAMDGERCIEAMIN